MLLLIIKQTLQMPDTLSQTDKRFVLPAQCQEVVQTSRTGWRRQLFHSVSPLTFWDSSSRRGSAAAGWPQRRRRWRWRTKFCFPANPCPTRGLCIPSLTAVGSLLGMIQSMVTFTLVLQGSQGELRVSVLGATQGQGIPLSAPSVPLWLSAPGLCAVLPR